MSEQSPSLQNLPENALAKAQSPYLLQHKHNPVHWMEWGEEAFQKTKNEDKAIFLSIGYATCHWCHVMAHESFEDQDVADLLNEFFVCIKLDREERPDIDQIYMTVCQLTTGQGGWPLSVFMTPDKDAFFATTYIPKESRSNRLGMMQLLPRIEKLWREDRNKLLDSAKHTTQMLQSAADGQKAVIEESHIHKLFEELRKSYDADYGGFNKAPKFPTPHLLQFLVHYGNTYQINDAFEMAQTTLMNIRQSGTYDQVGFGLHRYSTDKYWHLPHFEKMLYDQSMLISACTDLYRFARIGFAAKIADEVVSYLKRDMLADSGAFYSAEDADSEGEEGIFYTWPFEELKQLLDAKDFSLVKDIFQIKKDGNYYDEATREKVSRNILHPKLELVDYAIDHEISISDFQDKLERIRTSLLKHRSKRERPFLDDKILLDWNAQLIQALCNAAFVFERSDYLELAKNTYSALKKNLYQVENKRWYRRFRDGKAGLEAMAVDYAQLALAQIALFEQSSVASYLADAFQSAEILRKDFIDTEHGGVFSNKKQSDLIVQQKEFYDGVVPSVNSLAYSLFKSLFKLSGQVIWDALADDISCSFAPHFKAYPQGYAAFAKSWLDQKQQKLIILVSVDSTEIHKNEDLKPWLNQIRQFVKHEFSLVHIHPENHREMMRLIPVVREIKITTEQKVHAYICTNQTCSLPIKDWKALKS